MNFSGTETELAYFTGIDYVVLVILLSLSLAIGIYFGFFSKKLKTAEDYLVGGHQMKPFPIAISLVARYIQRKEREKKHQTKGNIHFKILHFQSIISYYNSRSAS